MALLLVLISRSSFLAGQVSSYFFQGGGSYLIHDPETINRLEEASLKTAVGINFNIKRWPIAYWAVGAKVQQVFFRDRLQDFEYSWLAGPFGRLGFREGKWGFYLESGVFTGNYCTCGLNNPFREGDIRYISFEPVGQYNVWENLMIDAGLFFHRILNRPQPTFGYNSYYIGLTVLIDK